MRTRPPHPGHPRPTARTRDAGRNTMNQGGTSDRSGEDHVEDAMPEGHRGPIEPGVEPAYMALFTAGGAARLGQIVARRP